ncbi:MAG: type transport system permease protein [Mycobacteriales bacterium]
MVEPVTQGRVIRSEWIKLRSVRSSWFALAATVLAVAGIGLLVSYVNHAHWSTMSAADRADIDPVNQSLIGVNLAELTVGVLGVLVAAGEYATGMVRATFAAVPRRLPVLVAKAGVLAAVAFTVCLVAVLIAFVGGQAIFGSDSNSPGSVEAVRAVLGATAYLTVVGVTGIGLGFLTRSTAGGIAILLAALLVLPITVASLPGSFSRTFERYLPSTAGRALFTNYGGDAMLSRWAGFGIFLLYAVLVVSAAALVLRRRDA